MSCLLNGPIKICTKESWDRANRKITKSLFLISKIDFQVLILKRCEEYLTQRTIFITGKSNFISKNSISRNVKFMTK